MFTYDILELASGLGGIGGLFGVLIFIMYRMDRRATEKRFSEDRKLSEERLSRLIEQSHEALRNNTAALTTLTNSLRGRNGN